MKYAIKKRNKVYDVIEIEYPFKGFKFKTKNEDIDSINVINEKMIDSVLTNKINKMFNRLLMIVNDAFNSDDNPEGSTIALDEIEMVRNYINNKYAKYLKKEKEELYLKKLELIEEEMRFKYYAYQDTFIENKGKGR